MVCLVLCTLASALTSKDFERVKQNLKSSLNARNGGESSRNWHRATHDTKIRLKTVLGVVVRAMSNGGYLLLKNPLAFRQRSVK
jgi:hypothetical protein